MIQYIVFLGVFLQFYGIFFYIRDMFRGTTKPNKVSWLLWSVAPLIATVAAIIKGVNILAVIPVFMSGFAPLIVFIISLFVKESYWQLGKFDYSCGVFSLLAIILWSITNEPNVAIVFAILADAAAGVPTLVKAWKEPETESSMAYITGVINTLTSAGAIRTISFSSLAFPIYLFFINGSIVLAIYRKKFFK